MAADGEEAERPLADTHQGSSDSSSGSLPVNFSPEDLADGLLRGVPFHEVVAGLGKHWQVNSLGSEAGRSWAYSTKVGRIKYFVSHSWQSSGWLKWLSLLALSNSVLAAVGATLAGVVTRLYCHYHTTTLTLTLPVQVRDTVWEVPMLLTPVSAAYTAGTLLFFAGHRLRQLVEAIGLLSPWTVFLDKLVIHQDDQGLMKRGIALLGAFLKSSDIFLVLWSEHYLSRLWCSYEVAVFLKLASSGHPGDIAIWPLPFTSAMAAKMVGSCLGIGLLWGQLFIPLDASSLGGMGWGVVMYATTVPTVLFAARAIAHLHRDVAALEQQVAGYSLLNCKCFSEDDRAAVEASVVAWFDAAGHDKDFCGNMLAFAYQYHAIKRIGRCFRGSQYIAVPQDGRSEVTHGHACGCVQLVLGALAYILTSMIFNALTFAPAMLPLPANICVSLVIVSWTAYEYW